MRFATRGAVLLRWLGVTAIVIRRALALSVQVGRRMTMVAMAGLLMVWAATGESVECGLYGDDDGEDAVHVWHSEIVVFRSA